MGVSLSTQHRLVSRLLCVGFVLTGVITTLLAPMLPLFAAKWSLSDAMVGCLFPAQFIGAKLGNVILSAGLIQRAGFRFILVLGYTLMSTGVGLLGIDLQWPLILIAVFCYGTGVGITIPATNLWVAESNPNNRAAKLNILNLAWSIGALLCPAAVALFDSIWGFPAFLITVAALAVIVSVSMLQVGRVSLPARNPDTRGAEHRSVELWTLFSMAALFFLYVGVENSVAGWISSLARSTNSTKEHWMLAPSFFWGMLLAGRALAPALLRRVEEFRLAMTGLVLAAAGTSLLIIGHGMALIYVGASICGLGLASVYPIAIASVSRAISPRAATAMFFVSGFGGATLPWIVGMISTKMESLRVGLTVPLVGILSMLVIESLLFRQARRQQGERALALEPASIDGAFE